MKIPRLHCINSYIVGLGWDRQLHFYQAPQLILMLVLHRTSSEKCQAFLGENLSPLVEQFWSIHNLALLYFSIFIS